MKNKKTYLFIFFGFLLLVSCNIFSMTTFEEDSWIGASIFDENLSSQEKLLPFKDIRKNHYKKNKAVNYFKTILADFIIVSNLETFDDIMTEEYNSEYEIIEYLRKRKKEGGEKFEIEIDLILAIKDEVIEKYEILTENINDNLVYRFYHINYILFEEVTLEHLKTSYEGMYTIKFENIDNEFSDSKKTTEQINNMIPLNPKNLKSSLDSPLVSLSETYYSKEAKEEMKQHMKDDGLIFEINEQAMIHDVSISIEDLEEFYDLMILLSEDSFIDKLNKFLILNEKDIDKLLNKYIEVI